MENFDLPLDSDLHIRPENNPEGLEVTPTLRPVWWEIGGWARYLSILMYVFMGISIFFIVIMLYFLTKLPMGIGITGTMKMMIFFSIFLCCLFFAYQAVYLGQFAAGLRNSMRYEASDWLEYSAEKLHAYYRFLGLISAIIIGFILLASLYINLMPARAWYEDF